KLLALAATSFTLSWTHSVEKTTWRESWTVAGDRLQLIEASVEGSGAGIAVPDDAVWADGRWTWRPDLAPLPHLTLAASGATASPWTLCPAGGECVELGGEPDEPVRLWAGEECGGEAYASALIGVCSCS
ncbi:MAG TPA: DUF1850 domain-containing protein, partial [Devosia sp.]|nr:DUF1850 domain-containing protein [Devosia sp.]